MRCPGVRCETGHMRCAGTEVHALAHRRNTQRVSHLPLVTVSGVSIAMPDAPMAIHPDAVIPGRAARLPSIPAAGLPSGREARGTTAPTMPIDARLCGL